MGVMDKTLKLHAYPDKAKSDVPQDNLAHKNAQLEEEKSKSLELLKTIVQLRESLKQEQAKTAEMEVKFNKLVVLEESQLAKKNAQLEEEKKKSLEQLRTIEQLRESIKQDQAKNAEIQAKAKELAVLEAKVKDLSAVLSKISTIAATGKLDNQS
jgi:chromosome segregation ATPase